MQEEFLAKSLHKLIREKHLSQQEIAEMAGVSQSTVSRALTGNIVRSGKGRRMLFRFMQQELDQETLLDGKDKVVRAFESVWDGSEEHAIAIAKIISASNGLFPAKSV
ncbi:MAG: XRE family transcriptional regulator [Blastocatellia bacterium]|nr:XRE family transcriptional regulator [Blastocatellia bacterium]